MSKKGLGTASFIVSLILDAFALQALLGPEFSRPRLSALVVVLHGLALLTAGFAFWQWLPQSYGRSRATFAALLTGFCSPVPVLGQLAIATFQRVLDQKVEEDPERNYVIGDSEAVTMHESFEEVHNDPRSVLDILRGHESKTRRNAILALRNLDARRTIPVLQKAIQDSDEQVRLLAQTQFTKIMASLEIGIKTIEAELNAGPRTSDRLIRLSELYHELVYLGLSSEESMKLYLDRSVELLEEARKLTPDDLNISVNLLRCHVKLGNTAAAEERLAFLRSKGYQRELLSPWESDLFYQERHWPALVESLGAVRPRPGRITILDAQVSLWVGDVGPKRRQKTVGVTAAQVVEAFSQNPISAT